MRMSQVLTCFAMTVGLLSGTAFAAKADHSNEPITSHSESFVPGMAALPPQASNDVIAAKGGKGKPTQVPTATPEPTEVPPGGGSLGDMYVSWVTVTYGSTQDTYGHCKAGIVDANGMLIEGAEVTFEVTDPWAGFYSATTVEQTPGLGNIFAAFTLRSRERYSCGKRGIPETWTCTVTDVYHFDYTYAPELNLETSDSDTCSDGPVAATR